MGLNVCLAVTTGAGQGAPGEDALCAVVGAAQLSDMGRGIHAERETGDAAGAPA